MNSSNALKIGRPKTQQKTSNVNDFSSASEILAALRNANPSGLEDTLKRVRNQLTVCANETTVAASDGRPALAKQWLEASPTMDELFDLLGQGVQASVSALSLAVLASLISLSTTHFIYHCHAELLIKKLLSSQWMRKISTFLSGSNTDVTLATLKLLNSIANFAGGREQKALLETFSWDVKLFHKLLYMRRKGRNIDSSDMLARPDIRTLCLLLVLSFLSSSSVKSVFLEQHRDIALSIFKGLPSDPYPVVRHVMETLWSGLWQDRKVKRTLKVSMFNETTVQHLLKVYERSIQEGPDAEHVPADVVHHFLLAICTHRGVGICFADNGWYPRMSEDVELEASNEGDDRDASHPQKGGRVFNKILSNVLQMLKVSEDGRQQELALKILQACPELVAGYLQAAGLTLEPRLSSRWLTNIAFLGSVVSLPVPTDSFLLPESQPGPSSNTRLYRPTPPPLSVVIENCFPSVNLKMHLTKGLQSSSTLIQHASALALVKCLMKCEQVLAAFRTVEAALGESEGELGNARTGTWTQRRVGLEGEVRKRVPDIQVIVAFSQQRHMTSTTSDNSIKSSLLSEVAQRLLWQYHRSLSSLIAEARFDVGKSLQAFIDPETGSVRKFEQIDGLERLKQLHVLRMLKESNQFVWSGKAASLSKTNIYILLSLFLSTPNVAIQDTLAGVISRGLSDSLLFQHEPTELRLWLDALPRGERAEDAEAPDGTKLTDEGESVLAFLDDCVQRCARTPHRYLEELEEFAAPNSGDESTIDESDDQTMDVDKAQNSSLVATVASSVSPLLLTVLEQLTAKTRAHLLSPSDMLAIATYARMLVASLLGKQPAGELNFFKKFTEKAAAVLRRAQEELKESYSDLAAALEHEAEVLVLSVARCAGTKAVVHVSRTGPSSDSPAIKAFQLQIEGVQILGENTSGKVYAYELVDWLRFIRPQFRPSDFKRFATVVSRLYEPALRDVFLHLYSDAGDGLWPCLNSVMDLPGCLERVPFDWLLLQTSAGELATQSFKSALRSVLKRSQVNLDLLKRLCGSLLHRIVHASKGDLWPILSTIADIVAEVLPRLDIADKQALKTFTLIECRPLRVLLCEPRLPPQVVEVLSRLTRSLLDPIDPADQEFVVVVCDSWVSIVEQNLVAPNELQLLNSLQWIKFMKPSDIQHLLALAQAHVSDAKESPPVAYVQVLEELLAAISRQAPDACLRDHLTGLLLLWSRIPKSLALEQTISAIIDSGIPLGIDGRLPSNDSSSLSTLLGQAESRWSRRQSQLSPGVDLYAFLSAPDWSESMAKAVSGAIYRSRGVRTAFWRWLAANDGGNAQPLEYLSLSINAYLEASSAERTNAPAASASEADFVVRLCSQMARGLFDQHTDTTTREIIASSLFLLLKGMPQLRARFTDEICATVATLALDVIIPEALSLLVAIEKHGLSCTEISEMLMKHALQYTVRFMSAEATIDETQKQLMEVMTSAHAALRRVSVHFSEPVITAAIRHHLLRSEAVRLVNALLSSAPLKPVNINRHLQGVIQHPQFLALQVEDESSKGAKRAIAALLYSLFYSHPANTCQPGHIQPLVRLYGGTLSTADRHLLAIFALFEAQKKLSVSSIIATWSPSGPTSHRTSLDAITGLDPGRVLRTCLTFPVGRTMQIDDPEQRQGRLRSASLYDPIFVVLLFAQCMLTSPPQLALSWVQLFRTNVVSLLLRCLSSRDGSLRRSASSQLHVLHKLITIGDMHEKQHVLYLLNLIRDMLHPTSQDGHATRLPSYTTLLLAHALRGVFYPSNFIYPLTARFLLQRSELDPHDVPMLFGMLYSSSDDWKKEKSWILRFLADGMQSAQDWRVLKRRHTWDLLASLLQSSNNRSLRRGVLEVLANLTCHREATTSLVLKSQLIAWIEIQLQTLRDEEALAWARLIENITCVVDADKMERKTMGRWRGALARCLTRLAHASAASFVLPSISRSLLRLSHGCLGDTSMIREATSRTVKALFMFEKTLNLARRKSVYRAAMHSTEDLPPYDSQALLLPEYADPLHIWAMVVENLWRVSLSTEIGADIWDCLSCRMLFWRAVVGEEGSPVGEWMRAEAMLLVTS